MKTVLVTGATDGIGQETAKMLAQRGVHVVLHGRNTSRLTATKATIETAVVDAKLTTIRADFTLLDEVRQMASEIRTQFSRLDGLINNAGVYFNDRILTPDGFEATFQINHLAPFLLTHLLLPSISAAEDGRIVHVSSIAHTRGRMRFHDLDGEVDFNGYLAYAQSKLANVLFSNELARRLHGHPASNSLHPGVVNTKLLNDGMGVQGPDSLPDGAATSVHLALSDTVSGVTGAYFSNGKQEAPAEVAQDRQAAQKLYNVSVERTGVSPLAPNSN